MSGISSHILESYQDYLASYREIKLPENSLKPSTLCYDPSLLGGVLITHSDMSKENVYVLKEISQYDANSFFTSCGGFFVSNK